MKEYQVKLIYNTSIEAKNIEDAHDKFWELIEESYNTAESWVEDNLIIERKKL